MLERISISMERDLILHIGNLIDLIVNNFDQLKASIFSNSYRKKKRKDELKIFRSIKETTLKREGLLQKTTVKIERAGKKWWEVKR